MTRRIGDFDPSMLVHAEQYFELHRPLPVTGTAATTSTVTGIYDEGSGALVVNQGPHPRSAEETRPELPPARAAIPAPAIRHPHHSRAPLTK